MGRPTRHHELNILASFAALTHVVDDDVNSLNIDTSTEDVSGNEDSLLESLELLESRDSGLPYQLRQTTCLVLLTARAGGAQSGCRSRGNCTLAAEHRAG